MLEGLFIVLRRPFCACVTSQASFDALYTLRFSPTSGGAQRLTVNCAQCKASFTKVMSGAEGLLMEVPTVGNGYQSRSERKGEVTSAVADRLGILMEDDRA